MRANKYLQAAGLAVALSLSFTAVADNNRDLEGRIESINYQARTFVVEGKTFYADERTDYDDDLERFSDLRVGQRVEVDYVMRKGRRYAKEVELDD